MQENKHAHKVNTSSMQVLFFHKNIYSFPGIFRRAQARKCIKDTK